MIQIGNFFIALDDISLVEIRNGAIGPEASIRMRNGSAADFTSGVPELIKFFEDKSVCVFPLRKMTGECEKD